MGCLLAPDINCVYGQRRSPREGSGDMQRKRRSDIKEHAFAADDRAGDGPRLRPRDAHILKEAMRGAISGSPEAFLMTVDDVNAKGPDYWEWEINSSTWVVIQRGGEVVGFAVARRPDEVMDKGLDPGTARFIESVWIDPKLRGEHLAERLVRFLFEAECAQTPGIRRFLLWVFDNNKYAIRLYERMGFRYVTRQDVPGRRGLEELRYEYWLEAGARTGQAAQAARRDDLRMRGLVYRVLGGDTE